MYDEEEQQAPGDKLDIHDVEVLKKVWFMLRDAEKSAEVFTLVQVLFESLPYDWITPQDNWLHVAQQLEHHGESELASLFKLANQRAFQLSLKGA
ncbi:MAG: hypothetical protein ACO1RX_13590 [Candidatus Sericytochromatia bacterium]